MPCRGLSTFLPPIRPLLTLYPVMCPKTAPFSYHVAYPVLCSQGTYLNMLGGIPSCRGYNVVHASTYTTLYAPIYTTLCAPLYTTLCAPYIPRFVPPYIPRFVPPFIPRYVPHIYHALCPHLYHVMCPHLCSQVASAEKVPGPGEDFCQMAGNLFF